MKTEAIFEDIKVGDTVYLFQEVYFNYSRIEKYLLPHIVDRVSPKQFKANGYRFRKSNGSVVSSKLRFRAYLDGDQTAEYQEAIRTLNLIRLVNKRITDLYRDNLKNITLEQVSKLRDALDSVDYLKED